MHLEMSPVKYHGIIIFIYMSKFEIQKLISTGHIEIQNNSQQHLRTTVQFVWQIFGNMN